MDEDWPSVAESLQEIRRELFSKTSAIVNLTSSENILTAADRHVSALLDSLPETSPSNSLWDTRLPSNNEGLVIPTQVIISLHQLTFCRSRKIVQMYTS